MVPPSAKPPNGPHAVKPNTPLGALALGWPGAPADLFVDDDGRPMRIDKAFSWEYPLAVHGLMSVSAPIRAVSRQSETTREEWDSRVELAACYRIFDMLGWTEMIFNHITLRVPGPERHFLINPYGLWYREVTASNLVKTDLEGNLIGASEWPVNRAGFVIHSAIHAAREDSH